MNTNTARSTNLLNKVYDHLESIDVSKLSMNELKDFLEVVQKGQFLESYGTIAPNPYGYGFGACAPYCSARDDGDTESELDQ